MESRSYALLAAAFSLLLLAGVILVAMFLTGGGTTLVDYDIVSTRAVSGLSEQSAVHYQGVPVGKVQLLNLDPSAPGRVHIRVGVAADTPITKATWAELTMQGITGLAIIDLHDDGSSTVRLTADGDELPTIPLRPGLFARLSEGGENIMGNLEIISSQLATLLNDQNVRTIQATMHSAAAASASWKDIGEQLEPIVGKLDPLVNNLNDASLEARGIARDLSALTREARTAIAHLDAPDGPLVMATRSLREITYATARLSSNTLPAVSKMADDVSATARSMSMTIREVGDMPQSIIFGLPPPRPGPGEHGFQGFGRGQ
jgi:phospholipid/cholesterol/gamma-HCH transport system substrate-binding protein